MDIQTLQDILAERLTDCQFIVTGDGRHFGVIAISERFKNLSKLKAQQYVFAALKDEFASGVIHALELKTYDLQSWKDNNKI